MRCQRSNLYRINRISLDGRLSSKTKNKQLLLGLTSFLAVPSALASNPVNPDKEIVYLTDCGEYVYSTMAYYPKAGESSNGIYQGALAFFDWVVRWEGSNMVGTYPDGNKFTSNINWGADHLGLGEFAGTGFNNFRKYLHSLHFVFSFTSILKALLPDELS